MFCHITQNWRGKPLVSQAVIVNLIGNTTTRTGLRVRAALDASSYEAGIKVRDEELAAVRIRQDKFTATGTTRFLPDESTTFCPVP